MKYYLVPIVVVCLLDPLIGGPPGSGKSDTSPPVPTARAAHLDPNETIILDGRLNESAWTTPPVVQQFVQRDPREGAAPSFDTAVWIAYDRSSLYIAVQAQDPEPEALVGILTRRDGDSPSDWIHVIIDSFRDRRTAYEFGVNPAGVKQDSYWYNDGSKDTSWDAVWDVEVSRDPSGWNAEFRVPLSQLRFDPYRSGTFGFAVVRRIGRLNETSTWPLLSKSANGYVSSFGELTGLELEGSAERLELVPYVLGDFKTRPVDAGNPFLSSRSAGATAGLDLKYALTPGLTLTATVNPDFGQVEADPAVVNLSAFETFFSERRPFFVEGSGIFRFDIDCNDGQCTGLFYSRRIGRPPQGSARTPAGGHAMAPAQTTILGAAKVTGRLGGFSIGALNAVTSEEQARIADGPFRSEQTVEPLTSFTVGRARKEFANQSSLGFMMTATNRRLTEDVSFLPAGSYAGGIDWDWRLSRARYSVSGYWAGSTVRGNTEAIERLQRNNVHSFQRPDAGHVTLDPRRTSLNGHTGSLSFGKIAGEHIRFNVFWGYKSPGFDVNDLGFIQRADTVSQSNWLQWRRDKPNRLFRSFRLNLNQWSGWNFDLDRRYRGWNINAHAVFTSNWSTGMGINFNSPGFDDRATRGGPGVRTNGETGFWHYINSDNRKPVYFGGNYYVGGDGHGSRVFDVGTTITFRPTEALSLSGGVNYHRNTNDSQWVKNVTDVKTRYVFGRLSQTTVSLTARVNYTITPTLSIQVYARPFVSAGDYGHFRALVDGRAPVYENRFAPFDFSGDPDFNFRSFRTTNVLRWEYLPGSTLFVVWQQSREDVLGRGDFRFGRDFGGIFDVPADNVFLVKLLYWLNM